MQAKSIKNQYLGVNAHLHSFWQDISRWSRFHSVHISDLMKSLRVSLLPMGYTAEIEESLQIRRVFEPPNYPHADVLIADLNPGRKSQAAPLSPAGAQIMTLDDVLEIEIDSEHPYFAIQLLKLAPNENPVEPVGWIELLSPSNKSGADGQIYRDKRNNLLHSELIFIELDYLHETPSTLWRVPDYTRQEPLSHPYRIAVLDPHPGFREGKAYHYPFDVDAPIPIIEIPLKANDVLKFDFGAIYHKTLEEGMYGYSLDYARLPVNFDRYSEADQTRIAARMLSILEAVRDGIDLETGPFPVKPLPLADCLAQIEAITGEKFA